MSNSVSDTLVPTNFDASVTTLICSVWIIFVCFGRLFFAKPENVRCLNLHCIMAGAVIVVLMVLVAKNQQREQDFQVRVYKECNLGLPKTHPLTERVADLSVASQEEIRFSKRKNYQPYLREISNHNMQECQNQSKTIWSREKKRTHSSRNRDLEQPGRDLIQW
ncbi:hypothetical protein TNCT_462661 [Trichonephila clavata]|uniref:Uncharacterized protein n=1 Tax=Trichonephila clavata TaxID=2740835 RepID=A0A8X6L003_TRICU|nr:hypothetical protein TNCT_462661 [Trichonephila clavata]